MQPYSEPPSLTESLENLLDSIERRSEERCASNTPVVVHLLNSPTLEALPGRIRNISPNGIRLRIERQLQPEEEVQIVMGDVVAVGKVCYAVPAGAMFDHGLAIAGLTRTEENRSVLQN